MPDDQEVDQHRNEIAIGEDGSLFLRRDAQRRGCDARRQAHEIIAEIEPSEDRPDDRHYQIVDDGGDDPAERKADDDTDGEIERITLEHETPEFLPHALTPRSRLAASPPARPALFYNTAGGRKSKI